MHIFVSLYASLVNKVNSLQKTVIQLKIALIAPRQSNPAANQRGLFLRARGTTVFDEDCYQRAFSCVSSQCAKHKSDQLSYYPQLFLIKHCLPWWSPSGRYTPTKSWLLPAPRKLYRNQLREEKKNHPTNSPQNLGPQMLIWHIGSHLEYYCSVKGLLYPLKSVL